MAIKRDRMASRPRNGRINLDAAVALMLQNQAALEAQMIASLNLWSETKEKLSNLQAETRETVAQIQRDFETVKAILARHEAMIERLTEAIREKIGFKGR